jgi:hypothetical protein
VGLLDRLGARRAVRTTGPPPSANGASSLHLRWVLPPLDEAVVAVAVSLTVVDAPQVDRLHFWALQASFAEGARHLGAAHVGLQHHPGHPGGAANWGGYGADGRELAGSASALPSRTANANTRDHPWEAGRPYRLGIRRGEAGWEGTIDGVAIRSLHAGGDRLTDPMVWSEVFARCDDPSSAVRWIDPVAVLASGAEVVPAAAVLTYQSVGDGGCTNTASDVDPAGGIRQRTNAVRLRGHGERLAW